MPLMVLTHFLLGYVGTTMCFVGLFFSLCSVYVFTRRQMRSAVSTYLTGLSLSDSFLLLFGFLFTLNYSTEIERQPDSFYSSQIYPRIFPYLYASINWFQFTSLWIIIVFAVDRWFAVKWPMLHHTYSSKRACYFVGTIYFLGFLYALPRFFEYKTEFTRLRLVEKAADSNRTEYVEYLVVVHYLGKSRVYQYCVHLILYSVFQSILPSFMLFYFNVELIRSINESSNFVKDCATNYGPTTRLAIEKTSHRNRDVLITRSVIFLILLFIVCQVPASILNYIYMYHRNDPLLYVCYDISNFLILFNSAVNFFIFTFFNRKFRRELSLICFRSNRSTTSSQSRRSNGSLNRTSSQFRFRISHGQETFHSDLTDRFLTVRTIDESEINKILNVSKRKFQNRKENVALKKFSEQKVDAQKLFLIEQRNVHSES